MTLPIQNTSAYWTPERRARQSARMRACLADPGYRQHRSILGAVELVAIVADARAGRPYIQVALDWLISEARVSQIARAAGIRRRGVSP